MRNIPFLLAGLVPALTTPCGSKTDATATDADSSYLVTQDGPCYVPCRAFSEKVGDCTVSIACNPDSATVVRDALETPFYDNLVTVTVNRAGSEIFRHTFRKGEFPGTSDAGSILQGMAFSERKGNILVFGAQVGEPGNDEGGQNFRVNVGTDGSHTITADFTQDTSAGE